MADDDLMEVEHWTDHTPPMNVTSLGVVVGGNRAVTFGSRSVRLQATVNEVLRYGEIAALVLVIIFGVIGNSVVFLLFYRRPMLRSFSNRFVLNLSTSHLLQCLLVIPSALISIVFQAWVLGDVACWVSGILSTTLNIASVLSLLLIALDRNCAVNSPLHYSMTVTKKRTGALITGIWALSLLVALPPLFGVSKVEFRPNWHICTMTWLIRDPYCIAYSSVLFVLGFAVPFLTTSCVYCSMFQAARNNTERARKHSLNSCTTDATMPETPSKTSIYTPRKKYRRWSSGSSQTSFFGDEWKAVRTGLLVVLTFTICWLPYFAIVALEAYVEAELFFPDYAMFIILVCSSSACIINPYIYVFRNKASRKHALKMLNCFSSQQSKSWLCQRRGQSRNITNKTNPCMLTASLVQNTSEKVKALPVLYQDAEGQWQVFSTSEERSREEMDETISNVSDDCFEKEPSDYISHCQRRKGNSNINVHAIYNNSFNRGYFSRNTHVLDNSYMISANRMLIFRLRSKLNRDSTSSDTTDNCSMSLDSSNGNDDSEFNPHSSGMRRSSVKAQIEDTDNHRSSVTLKRVNSFSEESTTDNQKHISCSGYSRRKSFIHSHIKHRKSSETTLTSSTNSETVESITATPSETNPSTRIRPKLVRQDTPVLPYFGYSEDTD